MTYDQFYDHIREFPKRFPNRDLEEYLSALLLLVLREKDQPLTPEKLMELLETAFSSEPIAFDERWLQITSSPDPDALARKFTNPDIDPPVERSTAFELEGVAFSIEVLRFQIAELHKMRGKQLDDPMRFFGVNSDSGNLWYNFDPFANLECGARGMVDWQDEDEDDPEIKVDWQTLGELLETGRIYE